MILQAHRQLGAHTCLCRKNSMKNTQESKPSQQGPRVGSSLLADGALGKGEGARPAERP